MTTPDPWAELPLTSALVEELSGGFLTADSPGSAAVVRRILSWMRRYCGWHVIGEVTETLTVDGTGARTVHLPTLRVVDVESVTEVTWSGSQLVDTARTSPADFTWSVHGVLEKRAGCWTPERRGIRSTVTHGFAEADELLGVVVAAAVRHSTAPDGNALSRVGEIGYQPTGAGRAGGSAFLQPEYAVLDLYRLNPEV